MVELTTSRRLSTSYTSLGWLRASVVLTKSQLGLGVLGIPQVFATVGMVPGLIMLFAIAFMTSW